MNNIASNVMPKEYNEITTDTQAYTGGIVGYGTGTCSWCYNTGEISALGREIVSYQDVLSLAEHLSILTLQ